MPDPFTIAETATHPRRWLSRVPWYGRFESLSAVAGTTCHQPDDAGVLSAEAAGSTAPAGVTIPGIAIHPRRVLSARSVAAGLFALLVAGCVTTDQLAPPIDLAMSALGEQDGYPVAQLERGRRVYLTDCTACHSPEPVARYSQTDWDEILPRMARDAKLNADEEAAVAAYVRVILMTPRDSAE